MARRFCLSGAPDARRKSAKNESEDEFKKKRKEKRPIQDRTHVSGSVAAVVEHPLNAAGLNIAVQRVLYAFFFEIV